MIQKKRAIKSEILSQKLSINGSRAGISTTILKGHTKIICLGRLLRLNITGESKTSYNGSQEGASVHVSAATRILKSFSSTHPVTDPLPKRVASPPKITMMVSDDASLRESSLLSPENTDLPSQDHSRIHGESQPVEYRDRTDQECKDLLLGDQASGQGPDDRSTEESHLKVSRSLHGQ